MINLGRLVFSLVIPTYDYRLIVILFICFLVMPKTVKTKPGNLIISETHHFIISFFVDLIF